MQEKRRAETLAANQLVSRRQSTHYHQLLNIINVLHVKTKCQTRYQATVPVPTSPSFIQFNSSAFWYKCIYFQWKLFIRFVVGSLIPVYDSLQTKGTVC